MLIFVRCRSVSCQNRQEIHPNTWTTFGALRVPDDPTTPGGGPLLMSLGCQTGRPTQVGDHFWCPSGARRSDTPRNRRMSRAVCKSSLELLILRWVFEGMCHKPLVFTMQNAVRQWGGASLPPRPPLIQDRQNPYSQRLFGGKTIKNRSKIDQRLDKLDRYNL